MSTRRIGGSSNWTQLPINFNIKNCVQRSLQNHFLFIRLWKSHHLFFLHLRTISYSQNHELVDMSQPLPCSTQTCTLVIFLPAFPLRVEQPILHGWTLSNRARGRGASWLCEWYVRIDQRKLLLLFPQDLDFLLQECSCHSGKENCRLKKARHQNFFVWNHRRPSSSRKKTVWQDGMTAYFSPFEMHLRNGARSTLKVHACVLHRVLHDLYD